MVAPKYLRRLFLAAPLAFTISNSALAQQEPCIGNSAAITGPAAFTGQAIRMGAEIALEEINAKGEQHQRHEEREGEPDAAPRPRPAAP